MSRREILEGPSITEEFNALFYPSKNHLSLEEKRVGLAEANNRGLHSRKDTSSSQTGGRKLG